MQPLDSTDSTRVYGKDGLRGTIVPGSAPTQHDASQWLIELDNGQRLLIPAEHLRRQEDGSYYLPLSRIEIERQLHHPDTHTGDKLVIPVLVDEFDIQKRVVETGKIRVTKKVHEHEMVVDEPLLRDEVEVERIPVDRPVEGPISIRYEDDTMIIPILEEVLVIQKQLILKEELHIRKRRIETHDPQQVTLRREEVHIDRIEAAE